MDVAKLGVRYWRCCCRGVCCLPSSHVDPCQVGAVKAWVWGRSSQPLRDCELQRRSTLWLWPCHLNRTPPHSASRQPMQRKLNQQASRAGQRPVVRHLPHGLVVLRKFGAQTTRERGYGWGLLTPGHVERRSGLAATSQVGPAQDVLCLALVLLFFVVPISWSFFSSFLVMSGSDHDSRIPLTYLIETWQYISNVNYLLDNWEARPTYL